MQRICDVSQLQRSESASRRPLNNKGAFFCTFSSPDLPEFLTKSGVTGPFAFGTLDSDPCILRCFVESDDGWREDHR